MMYKMYSVEFYELEEIKLFAMFHTIGLYINANNCLYYDNNSNTECLNQYYFFFSLCLLQPSTLIYVIIVKILEFNSYYYLL